MHRIGSFTLVPAVITLVAVGAFLLVLNFAIPPAEKKAANSNTNQTTTNTAGTSLANSDAANVNDTAAANTNAAVDTNSNSPVSNVNANAVPAGGVQDGVYVNTSYRFSIKLDSMTCGPFVCQGNDESVELYLGSNGAAVYVGKINGAASAEQWLKNAGLDHKDISFSAQTVNGKSGTAFINTANYQDYPGFVSAESKVSIRIISPSNAQQDTLLSAGGSRGFAAIHQGYVIVVQYAPGLGQAPQPEVYEKILANLAFQ